MFLLTQGKIKFWIFAFNTHNNKQVLIPSEKNLNRMSEVRLKIFSSFSDQDTQLLILQFPWVYQEKYRNNKTKTFCKL